jgi:hypothetical protein
MEQLRWKSTFRIVHATFRRRKRFVGPGLLRPLPDISRREDEAG